MLALQQTVRIRLQFRRPLGHTPFQFAVQLLELPSLSIELNEDLHLGAQQIRNDRNRHVVDRPHLIAPYPVNIGEMNG